MRQRDTGGSESQASVVLGGLGQGVASMGLSFFICSTGWGLEEAN